jgi:hypothetical protein
MGWDTKTVAFSDLKGLILTEIKKDDDYEIRFITDSGKTFVMNHEQDCCESVSVESIVGDLQDLIGSPILIAEESTSDKVPDGVKNPEYYDDSFTWTFYKLATIKGYVDIRWFGSSNGYYSESVDFYEV